MSFPTYRLSLTLVMMTVCLSCKTSRQVILLDESLRTVVPYVHPGDVVLFRDRKGEKFVPSFPLGAPCTDIGDLSKGSCTIAAKIPFTAYPYDCPEHKCDDPEIVVGSDAEPIVPGRPPH
jgi:hypothetical protein